MAGMGNVTRSVQANAPELVGGMVGVGAPIALREFADVQRGPLVTGQGEMVARFTRPSVVWGLGGGALTGLAWWADLGPGWMEDFFLAHTVTGVLTGLGSAALPKTVGGGGNGGGGGGGSTATPPRSVQRRRQGQMARTDGSGEFAPSGGRSSDTQPSE